MRIFENMTETRKAELIKQLRAVWTHDSTAIEGNTLALVFDARNCLDSAALHP